jgi:hypothetical protein
MKTMLGERIDVRSNHSARTFTIRTDVAKYRTYPMSKEEFQSCLNNTANDWAYFLKSSDYYKVK